MVFLIGQVLFEYKGALFWKMTAGMGDVVIAPLYQVLRRRGVRFEFFHRVDALHLDADRHGVDAITIGRQVRLADGIEDYEPLTTVRGLPVFPDRPLAEQLSSHRRTATTGIALRSAGRCRDPGPVPRRRLRPRGAGRLGGHHSGRRPRTDRRPARMAGDDHAGPDRGHPGVPDLVAADRIRARAGITRGRRSAPTSDRSRPGRRCRRRCGPRTGPTPTGRALSPTSAAASTRRGRRTSRPATICIACAAQVHADADAHMDRNLALFFPNAFADNGFDWTCDRRSFWTGAARQRQHRPVRPLRPVRARLRQVPAATRRKWLRQPGAGRRLDGLRDERRVYRGGRDVRPGGRQRAARPRPVSPDPGLLAAVSAPLSRYAATCWRLPQLPVSQNIRERLRDRSISTASQSGAAQILSRRNSPARIRSASAIAISAPIRWASGSWMDARCRCHSGISACRVSHGAARVSLSSALTCPTVRTSSSAIAQIRPSRSPQPVHCGQLVVVVVATAGPAEAIQVLVEHPADRRAVRRRPGRC